MFFTVEWDCTIGLSCADTFISKQFDKAAFKAVKKNSYLTILFTPIRILLLFLVKKYNISIKLLNNHHKYSF